MMVLGSQMMKMFNLDFSVWLGFSLSIFFFMIESQAFLFVCFFVLNGPYQVVVCQLV